MLTCRPSYYLHSHNYLAYLRHSLSSWEWTFDCDVSWPRDLLVKGNNRLDRLEKSGDASLLKSSHFSRCLSLSPHAICHLVVMYLSQSAILLFFFIWLPVILAHHPAVWLCFFLFVYPVSPSLLPGLTLCIYVYHSLWQFLCLIFYLAVCLTVLLSVSTPVSVCFCLSVWIRLSMWLYGRFLSILRRPLTSSLLTWDYLKVEPYAGRVAVKSWGRRRVLPQGRSQ